MLSNRGGDKRELKCKSNIFQQKILRLEEKYTNQNERISRSIRDGKSKLTTLRDKKTYYNFLENSGLGKIANTSP
jgi:hypothetical protein